VRILFETGAILNRPDGFVAWRAPSQEVSPIEELADALEHVLARPMRSPLAGPRVHVRKGWRRAILDRFYEADSRGKRIKWGAWLAQEEVVSGC
jgi:hypothetical protein